MKLINNSRVSLLFDPLAETALLKMFLMYVNWYRLQTSAYIMPVTGTYVLIEKKNFVIPKLLISKGNSGPFLNAVRSWRLTFVQR